MRPLPAHQRAHGAGGRGRRRGVHGRRGVGRAGLGAFFAPQVAIDAVKITREGFSAGATIGGDVMQMPATFVVDQTGQFRLAYYSRSIADHPSDDVVRTALRG